MKDGNSSNQSHLAVPKPKPNLIKREKPDQIAVPEFVAEQKEDLGLEQIESESYAVGYGDISTVMATARRGYAQGAKEAFEEGAIESSSFRKQVLSSAVGAMFGGS